MWSFIASEFGLPLLGIALAIGGAVLAFFKGRSEGKKLERADQTKKQLETRKEWDEIDRRPRDPAAAYKRLRDRN